MSYSYVVWQIINDLFYIICRLKSNNNLLKIKKFNGNLFCGKNIKNIKNIKKINKINRYSSLLDKK
jgi:hypothetical protein